jgi:hypothetical protein
VIRLSRDPTRRTWRLNVAKLGQKLLSIVAIVRLHRLHDLKRHR